MNGGTLVAIGAAKERERIADWLMKRAQLIMQHDREGALELSICSGAIRANKLGPMGMHGDEPILGKLEKDLK